MRRLVVMGLLMVVVPGPTAAQTPTEVGARRGAVLQTQTAYPPVALSGTVVRSLPSTLLPGREYLLYIAVPPDTVGVPGQGSSATRKFPTLYFLDAYNQFGLVLQTYALLRAFNDIPPLLIVGISYPGTPADFIRNRALDFTPTYMTTAQIEQKYGTTIATLMPASGGADRFLRVLSDEIIPFVEREYPADPADRGIFGDSGGGIFTAYVLFNRPTLFQRYLIASPGLFWDDFTVLKDEERYAASHRQLRAKVVATVGADEGSLMVNAWQKLRERLAGRSYAGLTFTPLIFEGETHVSVQGHAYSVALRRLYGGPLSWPFGK